MIAYKTRLSAGCQKKRASAGRGGSRQIHPRGGGRAAARFLSVLILALCVSAAAVPAEASPGTAAAEGISSAQETAAVKGGGAAVSRQLSSGGYATKLYDSTNGLPTSEANAILATSDGFIWIGSYSGLIRYDGTSFERCDSTSTGLTSGKALYEDSRGRLWVGTNDNGAIMLERGETTQYSHAEGLLSSSIRSIAEDGEGTVYLGTTHGIATVDTSGKCSLLSDPQITDAFILTLAEDPSGNIYGNTKAGAVFCITSGRVTAYYNGSDLGTGEITTVFPDPIHPGFLYLGTNDDSIYYGSFDANLTDLQEISVSPASGVNWITYASGRIWVCTESMVGYLDEQERFTPIQNLPMNNSIVSMIEDYEGNLWFASTRQGVMKIVSNRFTNISEMAGLEADVVNSTCLHGGELYIGTDTGLWIVDQNYNVIENELTALLDGARIRCISEDLEGNLWISTYTGGFGLVCFRTDGEIVTYTEGDGLLSDKTRCTVIAPDGSVLAATNGGLNVLKNGEITAGYGAASGISNTVILTTAESENGGYYLGTDGDGIYVVEGNKVSRLGLDDGLTSEVVMRIKRDEERGVYWIVTSNSLAYLKDGAVTTIQSFPYSNNFDIYFDDAGNAWVLASNGIYVVNAEAMLSGKAFEYLFYDTSSGLPSVATGNSFSALGEDGTLYIAGRTGVSSVNVNEYFEGSSDTMLTVPYIDADNVRYYIESDGTVTIPSSTKVLTIYGYVLTYSMQDPRVQYFLEGFDTAFTNLSKSDMEPVRYTNLGGGRYTFHLSVVNTSTGEVQKTISVTIIKKMAFYEQPWFWIAAAVIAAVLISLIVRRYIRKHTEALARKSEERRIFVNEIVDAFANCIDSKDEYTRGHSRRVAEYTKMLAEKLGESPETVEDYKNIALMHDIGKISIPDAILNKQGKLTDEEYEIMKSHAERGYQILKDVRIQEDLAAGAYYHHERYDGKGYPQGLKGEEIPWVARIIAVADTFDAMFSTRPYRKQLPLEYVAGEIEKGAGTQHDPRVVEKFMELVREGAFDYAKEPEDGSPAPQSEEEARAAAEAEKPLDVS